MKKKMSLPAILWAEGKRTPTSSQSSTGSLGQPGSAWERLTACMMKGSNMVKESNVYINFQLTKERAVLAKAVRKAKTDGRIGGYSVDQNGRMKIKKLDGDKEYKKVTSVDEMNSMLEK